MAPSNRGILRHDPFGLCPTGPGPLGTNLTLGGGLLDSVRGDTPGPLGCNDYASPEMRGFTLGAGTLHLTISVDRDLKFWDYDPDSLLNDPHLHPEFVEAAHRMLETAVDRGLRPQVHEAYRSPEESDRKHANWKRNQGGKANAAWRSCHNYGLAMDVYLYDKRHRFINEKNTRGWYKHYKKLAKTAADEGLVWGGPFDDSVHFEFHPNWDGGARGRFLADVKAWAEQAAVAAPGGRGLPDNVMGPPAEPAPEVWLPYFWWAAGVDGALPPATVTAPPAP